MQEFKSSITSVGTDRVDARVWRSRNCLVILLLQLLGDLGPD